MWYWTVKNSEMSFSAISYVEHLQLQLDKFSEHEIRFIVSRDVVLVSTSRSRDVVSKRLGLVETWEGLDLVSDLKSNVSISSRSRTMGSRLQANVHSFLLHCKSAPTSFWMQGVYIVYWFTGLLIYCSARAYQDATWYGCMPRPRRHCVTWEPSPSYQGHSSPPPIVGPCLFWKNNRPSQLLLSTCHITLDTFLHDSIKFDQNHRSTIAAPNDVCRCPNWCVFSFCL